MLLSLKSGRRKASSDSSKGGGWRQTIAYAMRAFHLMWDAGPSAVIWSLLLNSARAAFPVAILWVTKLLIDNLTHPSSIVKGQPIASLLVVIGVLMVGERGIVAISGICTDRLRFIAEQHAYILFMRKLAHVDIAVFENQRYLDRVENATRGLAELRSVTVVILAMAANTVTLALFTCTLLKLRWWLIAVVVLTALPDVVVAGRLAHKEWAVSDRQAHRHRLRSYLAWLLRQRDPAKEIRAFGLGNYIISRFQDESLASFHEAHRVERLRRLGTGLAGLLSDIGMIGIWVYTISQAQAGMISVGDIVLFTQAASQAGSLLQGLFGQGGAIYQSGLFLGNLFSLLDTEPSASDGALAGLPGTDGRCGTRSTPQTLRRGIEFQGVSFRYPGTKDYILHDVDLVLRPGESAAIVGGNGVGKTTLIKLLVRLYDPTEGRILLDGRDLREYDLAALRSYFGITFQDFQHYFFTARENIGFGQLEYVDDVTRIRRAATQTGIDDCIARLPEGYETFLGRQFGGTGAELSGGEWQKLALARAVIRESPILVLDEPTASLDALAEQQTYESLQRLAADRTLIFVSHRFSTVRIAKHIVVLDSGMVTEEGTHEGLLEKNGLYARMFLAQADAYRA